MDSYKIVVHYVAKYHNGRSVLDYVRFYKMARSPRHAESLAKASFSRRVKSWRKKDPNVKAVTTVKVVADLEWAQLGLLEKTDTPLG